MGLRQLKNRTSVGFGSLWYSKDKLSKQKTSKEGWPSKNRVEAESMPGVPSVSAATKSGRNNDTSVFILTNHQVPNGLLGGLGRSAA